MAADSISIYPAHQACNADDNSEHDADIENNQYMNRYASIDKTIDDDILLWELIVPQREIMNI